MHRVKLMPSSPWCCKFEFLSCLFNNISIVFMQDPAVGAKLSTSVLISVL